MKIMLTNEYVTLPVQEQCDYIFKFTLDSANHVVDLNPIKVRSLPLSETQTTLIKRMIQSLMIAPLVTLLLLLLPVSCEAQSSGINNHFQRDQIRYEIAQEDRAARRGRIEKRREQSTRPSAFAWRFDRYGFRISIR